MDSDIKLIVLGTLLSVPMVALAAFWAEGPLLMAGGLAICFALLGLIAVTRGFKPLLGVALIGQCIALTAAFTGHPWQIDSHMVFFAALALLVLLRDIKTILVATVAIAVHHLSLSLLLPALVYPSASLLENLIRTGFHAVVVLTEAAGLCAAIHRQNQLVATVEQKASSAEEAMANERAALAERDRAAIARRDAMGALANALQALSQGNLTARINVDVSADFEGIKHDFNSAMQKLHDSMSQVLERSDGISAGTDSLASVSDQLAHRTEQQAASVTETTQTMAQIKVSVENSAESADGANAMANVARQLAEDGRTIVSDAVSAMKAIEEGSTEISRITATIEDIAFQTNLLALNAGVEAARAGSAGLGFAVVASEVRNLAQRASEAAKEIAGLISNSQEQVRSGATHTAQANDALAKISEQVVQVSEAVANITDATKTQAVGIREVDAAMSELDQLTQHNAAMVEEATAASNALRSDVTMMRHSASAFLLSNGHQPPLAMAS